MTPVVRVLLITTVAAYLLQVLFDWMTGNEFSLLFGLSRYGLKCGYLWQLVTYMFLHGRVLQIPGLHLLVNMLGLYFIGPETERGMGSTNFAVMYFLSGILGGLGWVLTSSVGFCVGASGAIFGVLAAFATMYPNERITLLLFFIIPITLRAWILVLALALVQLPFMFSGRGGNVAYGVHVGGALVGFLYTWVITRGGQFIPLWFKNRKAKLRIIPGGGRKGRPTSEEIDRILDKIGTQGIGSLSDRERDLLKKASN